MTKRFTDSDIWTKDWFLDLSLKQKLLVKFLFDNCDCAGFYEISYRTLKNCFNEEITRNDFIGIKQVKFISENVIFIEDFITFQCGISSLKDLNPKNNAHKGILKRLEKYGASEGLVSPYLGAQEKEQEEEKEKENNSSKLYGEYQNVYLSKNQYEKLLGMCLSETLLNELLNSFSIAIEVGKERPYIAELPNAHYERIKSYYNYRKKNPNNFQKNNPSTPYSKVPESKTSTFKPFELSDKERKESEEARRKFMENFKKQMEAK